jgi:hypothetical protein
MSRNGIVLTVIAAVLAAVYVFYFTEVFNKQVIQIIPQVRPNRVSAIPRGEEGTPVYPVSFALDGKYQLTSVKVVAADDLKTNKYPEALWHLISDSNSLPTKSFLYGQKIPGMKPSSPRAKPMALQPNVSYTLLLEAGKTRGRTNFFTREVVQPNAQ